MQPFSCWTAVPPRALIARYRKEATDGLDDTQLRETRLGYLRELEDRRAAVLKSIEEQAS